MSELFNRTYRLTVGPVEISNLKVEFRVRKTIRREANTCKVKIWNLNEDHRHAIAVPPGQAGSGRGKIGGAKKHPKTALTEAERVSLRLEAGYNGEHTQLYFGEVRAGIVKREGPDVITELSSGDSEKEMAKARINISYGPKTPPEEALKALVSALGVGQGNLTKALQLLKSKGVGSFGATGKVLSGNAARELHDFCRSAGLEWSIQDGQIQFLDLGTPLETKSSLLLRHDTGLIGSPAVDSSGAVEAETLLIPGIRPGVIVTFDTEFVTGSYRITDIDYKGDSYGQDWTSKFIAQKY